MSEGYARFSFDLDMDHEIHMDCQCGWSMRIDRLSMLLIDLIDAADGHSCEDER